MKDCFVIDNGDEVCIKKFDSTGNSTVIKYFDTVTEAEDYADKRGIVISGEIGDYD